ncbi:hypothetical protein ABZ260_45460 [Streptosporangium sp. NPDC006013]|uniref:hypothetical protein n=1 Tax=Streptosporangium sp. NPDC006013 TaxID=3155596 RepID=UPI0033A9D209
MRREPAHDPGRGTGVVLTQTVPARPAGLRTTALAAWQTHLESLFAAVQGEPRCRPEGRVGELRKLYEERLG